jgi:hypothetical protein
VPGFARELPAAPYGLARRGFVGEHDTSRGLTRQRCVIGSQAGVGLSTTVPLLSTLAPLKARLGDRDRIRIEATCPTTAGC